MSNIYAKSGPEWTSLAEHALHVASVAKKFAKHLGMNQDVAYNGAILHDIGKAHPFFQKRLKEKINRCRTFRHEIASLFFLSAFPKEQHGYLIEMVVSHHKSVKYDIGLKGLLDLEENDDYIDFHLGNWDEWSKEAIDILKSLGIECDYISEKNAIRNLDYCIDYCKNTVKQNGYSEWKGLLMGADHFASSLIDKTESQIERIFKTPNLDFYNRQHELFPLSLKSSTSEKRHTIVVACTGAGKTDYLFRRCKGRVFYTLPFQASINAMYKRVGYDLEKNNPDLDIRVLHSTSIIVKRKEDENADLQNLMGSSVKILTPHQLATIALGMSGYEAIILDIKGCDVILDEVHTYSGISQALVLKIIEVLKSIDCNIHIGTATMPSILYNKIKDLLGNDVLEVKLEDEELDKFNRHIVYKVTSFELTHSIIEKNVRENNKVLIVMNTIKDAQDVYKEIKELYPNTPSMLLHSKFKRGDRNIKEKQLLGLDNNGVSTNEFNTSNKACIVVSTQIVEVSLDISFDLMITGTAPLDAMIQRFGRINRKRNKDTIGKYKDIYIIEPPEDLKDNRPYNIETIRKSYDVLEDGELLQEKGLQQKIDKVFTDIDFLKIEEHSVFKPNEGFILGKLTHRSKSVLFDLLDIDSACCILESDEDKYSNGDFETRLNLEMSVSHWKVANMRQVDFGNKPFIIPDIAYSYEFGLNQEEIKEENFNVLNRFL